LMALPVPGSVPKMTVPSEDDDARAALAATPELLFELPPHAAIPTAPAATMTAVARARRAERLATPRAARRLAGLIGTSERIKLPLPSRC
jgi:hypothetical protein